MNGRYQIITVQKGRTYSLFDTEGKIFVVDNVTKSDVVTAFLNEMRHIVESWVTDSPKQMSYLEAKILAGRIKCIMCKQSMTKDNFDIHLPEEKQWCPTCRGKL